MASALTFGGGASGTALTTGDLTVGNSGADGRAFKASWTAAMVAALGGGTTGNLKVATLPAKTLIRNTILRVETPYSDPTTLTASVGTVATDYIDLVVASNAKVQGTYGDASAERGTNATGYYIPSLSGTTDVYVQFVISGGVLSDIDSFAGYVILDYVVLP